VFSKHMDCSSGMLSAIPLGMLSAIQEDLLSAIAVDLLSATPLYLVLDIPRRDWVNVCVNGIKSLGA
jgi:hypothetical protein